MNISVFMISVCCGLILLSIISCMMNPLFRMPKEEEEDAEPEDISSGTQLACPPLSLIIMVHGDVDTLERNMPLFLSQQYASGFQIIVVANEGDSEASDLMKRYKDEPRLQSTFIPMTARYISKEKLGITLGVKAAKHEWCLLIDGRCYPESDQWLAKMGAACTDENSIVMGYSNFSHESKVFQRFSRLRHFARIYREATNGTPYASTHSNLAFRKSDFIKGDGYRGNLECVRGEYDFIVNKYAEEGRTAVVTDLDAMITEDMPTKKLWRSSRLFYIHSCKLMKHGFWHKMLGITDSILLHLTWILSILAIIAGAMVQNWVVLGSAVLALLISIVWRTVIGRKASLRFNAKIPAWAIVLLELTSVWHTLSDRIHYRTASKYDFTCHKL